MPGVSKIVYKGKEIIYVDYRGCTDEKEMITIFRQAGDLISHHPEKIPVLINFEDAYQTPNYMREAKQIIKQTQPFVTKRALVGISNPTRLIILQTFNKLLGEKAIKPFKTLKEAKDWLIK